MKHKYNYELFQAFKGKGFRAYQVAALAGIERTRFCRILTGKYPPTSEEKKMLSKILHVPQKKLFK